MRQEQIDKILALRGLDSPNRHRTFLASVQIGETNLMVADGSNPMVGYRDSMRVPPKILQRLFGSAKGRLEIHDPTDGSQLLHKSRQILDQNGG